MKSSDLETSIKLPLIKNKWNKIILDHDADGIVNHIKE